MEAALLPINQEMTISTVALLYPVSTVCACITADIYRVNGTA